MLMVTELKLSGAGNGRTSLWKLLFSKVEHMFQPLLILQ
jgi:hypothetical protein